MHHLRAKQLSSSTGMDQPCAGVFPSAAQRCRRQDAVWGGVGRVAADAVTCGGPGGSGHLGTSSQVAGSLCTHPQGVCVAGCLDNGWQGDFVYILMVHLRDGIHPRGAWLGCSAQLVQSLACAVHGLTSRTSGP